MLASTRIDHQHRPILVCVFRCLPRLTRPNCCTMQCFPPQLAWHGRTKKHAGLSGNPAGRVKPNMHKEAIRAPLTEINWCIGLSGWRTRSPFVLAPIQTLLPNCLLNLCCALHKIPPRSSIVSGFFFFLLLLYSIIITLNYSRSSTFTNCGHPFANLYLSYEIGNTTARAAQPFRLGPWISQFVP